MTPPNGRSEHAAAAEDRQTHPLPGPSTSLHGAPFSTPEIRRLIEALEVPFEPSLIEWRVTNTAKVGGRLRGQVIPYADQRAYIDRLNVLFMPAGWTRRYTVQTSANFQRGPDNKTTAKVFVTCDLIIFGVGSHSATGEKWADDQNAGTSAEAQAFKRACSCFGLGRYLYHFTGTWVDVDERRRSKGRPVLPEWATPEGWKQGLRPATAAEVRSPGNRTTSDEKRRGLVRQIENMAKPLGTTLYRGLLKSVARAWNPADIKEYSLLENLLRQMQAAERDLVRLETAYLHTGAEPLAQILRSVGVHDMEQVRSLEQLEKIVLALEAKAAGHPFAN